jgi:hypothetical protein
MTSLTTAVCSITSTARRRFFWAAWWTAEPSYAPFRKPDAANGGARSLAEALADAERAAGRSLQLIDAYWARAWKRTLRGEDVAPPPEPKSRARPEAKAPRSSWVVLDVPKDAGAATIRKAFHKKALETHPDQGGDAERFREVLRAFKKLSHPRASRKRR